MGTFGQLIHHSCQPFGGCERYGGAHLFDHIWCDILMKSENKQFEGLAPNASMLLARIYSFLSTSPTAGKGH